MLRHDKSNGCIASIRRDFRQMVAERRAILVPGASNALTARLIEAHGFEALYLSNMELGIPDLGLVTMTEIAEATRRISDVTGLPLIVDIDTGFGNALNVHRTIRSLEAAGAAALQIEDQVFPKRCGHFSGKAVVPLAEMLAKIHAATDARHDENIQIIARTDAIAVEGIEAALERAEHMAEAGADIIFVEAPETDAQMKRVGQMKVPQIANIVFGGRTPMLSRQTLEELGFSLVLYANAALQATIRSVGAVLDHLRDTGSLAGAEEQLADFDERQRAVAKRFYDEMEQRYRTD